MCARISKGSNLTPWVILGNGLFYSPKGPSEGLGIVILPPHVASLHTSHYHLTMCMIKGKGRPAGRAIIFNSIHSLYLDINYSGICFTKYSRHSTVQHSIPKERTSLLFSFGPGDIRLQGLCLAPFSFRAESRQLEK